MTPDETFAICGFRLNAGTFSTHTLLTYSNGGEFFINVAPVFYLSRDGRLFQIPHAAQSDGISAPKFAAAFGRAAGGDDWVAGWFHDAAYRNTLLVWTPVEGAPLLGTGFWKHAALSKDDSDGFLKECALACGDTELEAETLFQAVNHFGGRAFKEDR